MRRVEAEVHARCQPQCHVAPVAMDIDQTAVAQQVRKRIAGAFDLIEIDSGDCSKGADNRVAGADEDLRISIDRAHPRLQVPDEAIVQAVELRGARLAQIEVGKEAPYLDGNVAYEWLLDAAEPTGKLG